MIEKRYFEYYISGWKNHEHECFWDRFRLGET
jgi:hypothetical protein